MSEQPDVEAVAAWFMERQRLLFEVIEGTRYDLEEHVSPSLAERGGLW